MSLYVMSHTATWTQGYIRVISWETRLGNRCYPPLVTAANFFDHIPNFQYPIPSIQSLPNRYSNTMYYLNYHKMISYYDTKLTRIMIYMLSTDIKKCPKGCSCRYKGDDLETSCSEGWTLQTVTDLAKTSNSL